MCTLTLAMNKFNSESRAIEQKYRFSCTQIVCASFSLSRCMLQTWPIRMKTLYEDIKGFLHLSHTEKRNRKLTF